jgi:hypothetical protein
MPTSPGEPGLGRQTGDRRVVWPLKPVNGSLQGEMFTSNYLVCHPPGLARRLHEGQAGRFPFVSVCEYPRP